MNGDEDREFDQHLSRHLADKLDPHCGRAVAAFERQLRARSAQRRRMLMAASIALVFFGASIAALWRASPRSSPTPGVLAEKTTTMPTPYIAHNIKQLIT